MGCVNAKAVGDEAKRSSNNKRQHAERPLPQPTTSSSARSSTSRTPPAVNSVENSINANNSYNLASSSAKDSLTENSAANRKAKDDISGVKDPAYLPSLMQPKEGVGDITQGDHPVLASNVERISANERESIISPAKDAENQERAGIQASGANEGSIEGIEPISAAQQQIDGSSGGGGAQGVRAHWQDAGGSGGGSMEVEGYEVAQMRTGSTVSEGREGKSEMSISDQRDVKQQEQAIWQGELPASDERLPPKEVEDIGEQATEDSRMADQLFEDEQNHNFNGFHPKLMQQHSGQPATGDGYHVMVLHEQQDLIDSMQEGNSLFFLDPDPLPLPAELQPSTTLSSALTVPVPNENIVLRFSYLTQRGYYPEAPGKPNQDAFCVCPQFGGDSSDHLFAIFDGHGEHGTPCSQFARDRLCENLLRHRQFRTNVPVAFHGAFLMANLQLHRAPVDDTMSGTTGIAVLLRGRTLYAANVGDSRAVLAEVRDGGRQLAAVDLSSDQTPFRQDECERVRACGARVLTLDQLEGLKNPHVQCWGGEDDDDGDPPRLWVQNGMYPGTAFTRSIGDTVAERIGVTAVPEVVEVQLTEQHPFFVVASDGVFEFLSSQDVVDMVAKYNDPHAACTAVVAESYKLWLQFETRTDDITIIVVHLDFYGEGSDVVEMMVAHAHLTPQRSSAADLGRVQRRPIEGMGPGAEELEDDLSVDGKLLSELQLVEKTPEERARLEQAMLGNFLFDYLNEQQQELLYKSMQKLIVRPGDFVIRQGDVGDRFFVCDEGEFEVLVSTGAGAPDGGDDDVAVVVHRYTSEAHPCFGDLALMYGTRREASVRAATDGALWVLHRSAFRRVQQLGSRGHWVLLRTLRSLPLLAPLTLGQLQRLASSMQRFELQERELLVRSDEEIDRLYIVESGDLEVFKEDGSLENGSVGAEAVLTSSASGSVLQQRLEPLCLGEWLVTGAPAQRLTALAKSGPVQCLSVTPQLFVDLVGSLPAQAAEDRRLRHFQALLHDERRKDLGHKLLTTAVAAEVVWEETLATTDCSEIGLVLIRSSGVLCSMKRYSKVKVQRLSREEQVWRERSLLQTLSPSPFVPPVVVAMADNAHVSLLLDTRLVTPLWQLLETPLPEPSVRYIAASLVLALQLLHRDAVVFRGVAPTTILLDDEARIQLADLRFAKRLTDGRTFTLCGAPDFLAPETIAGLGHGQAADWWALGVLIFTLLHGEGPFGSWKDSELQIYTRIAKRQLQFPQYFSDAAVSLIDQLLASRPEERLGCCSGGVDGVKSHPWFAGVPWDDLLLGNVPVPEELRQRLEIVKSARAGKQFTSGAFALVDDIEPVGEEQPWFEGW